MLKGAERVWAVRHAAAGDASTSDACQVARLTQRPVCCRNGGELLGRSKLSLTRYCKQPAARSRHSRPAKNVSGASEALRPWSTPVHKRHPGPQVAFATPWGRAIVAPHFLLEMSMSNAATVAPDTAGAAAPRIRRLEISRFRGIKHLVWHPAEGLNLILGGGDVGKTTILDAIALLLSPTNPTTLTDFDYYDRAFVDGFVIDAVMSLPEVGGIQYRMKASWPWDWNGTEAVPPTAEGEETFNDPVYCLRVQGTADLEVLHEIVQPDGTSDGLSYIMRRAIGLVRLGGDDRNDRDLRLVHGSALDRLLSDPGLRSRMTNQLAQVQVSGQLGDNAKTALGKLNKAFDEKRLPTGLDLALTGGAGPSIASMVALTAKRKAVPLPLTSWGSGTRRLAALSIAEHTQTATPLTIVDEVERGLEPYRQQALIDAMIKGPSQAFATTHSPFVIRAAATSALWYLDQAGNVGALTGQRLREFMNRSPTALLARLTIIVEGATELGFLTGLLNRAFGGRYAPYGIVLAKGNGHESSLQLLEDLTRVGLTVGGFADEEDGRYPDRWLRVGGDLGPLLFRWAKGCTEQNVIAAVRDEQLQALIDDPGGGLTGARLRTLADRLGSNDKSLDALRATASAASKKLHDIVIAAAMGQIPDQCDDEAKKAFKRHAATWFKSVEGGQELHDKVVAFGLWPQFKERLLPFCNAVRATVGLEALTDVQL